MTGVVEVEMLMRMEGCKKNMYLVHLAEDEVKLLEYIQSCSNPN